MKKKVMLLTFMAALAFAGCSNDDDITNNGGGGTDTEGCGYVAVNIVQPSSTTGRATDANDFENGSSDENYAEEGLFFLFDQAGTTKYAAKRLVLSPKNETNPINPAVEQIYKGVLVIDGVKQADGDDETDSKQIVCVLNAPAELETGVNTLADLEAKIADYCTSQITKGKFIMTNSVYMNGANKVLGTGISKIYNTVGEARKNSVDIFVERVVAKVKISGSATFTNNGTHDSAENEKVTVDGVENNGYEIKVTGVSIANVANQAYLFKNISGFSGNTAYAWAWDPGNKRSYWETVSLSSGNFINKSYTDIYKEWNTEASEGVEAKDFDVKNFAFDPEYIQPNTISNKASNGTNLPAQKTAVLLTAQLLDKTSKQPVKLVYLRGGYFTKNNALDVIADYVMQNKYYKGRNTATNEMEYSSLLSTDFEWTNEYIPAGKTEAERIPWIEDYEAVAKVNSKAITDGGYTIYKKTDTGYVAANATEIDALLRGTESAKSPYTAWVWTDGKCYYFVNIDQSPVAADHSATTVAAHTYDGVVRNHIYDLTLNSVKGLGVPVFDPDIDIIPQTPTPGESLFYLSATVKVLEWRLVKQTVDFEN